MSYSCQNFRFASYELHKSIIEIIKHLQLNQFGKEKNQETQSTVGVFLTHSGSMLFSQLAASDVHGKVCYTEPAFKLLLFSFDFY